MNVDLYRSKFGNKIQIVSDLHSVKTSDLGKAIKNINADVLLFPGLDVDDIDTAYWLLKEMRRLENNRKKVHVIGGDHELSFYGGVEISSSEIKKQGGFEYLLDRIDFQDKSWKQLAEEQGISSKEVLSIKDFFRILTDRNATPQTYDGLELFLDENREIKTKEELGNNPHEYQIRVLHGALESREDLSGFGYIATIWHRLEDIEDHILNFKRMEEKGDDILIRGHDHHAEFAYYDPETGIHIFQPWKLDKDDPTKGGTDKRAYILEKHLDKNENLKYRLLSENVTLYEHCVKPDDGVWHFTDKPNTSPFIINGADRSRFLSTPFLLKKGRKYVITAGAAALGWTATIRTIPVGYDEQGRLTLHNSPVLEFHGMGSNSINYWHHNIGRMETQYMQMLSSEP